MQSSQKMAGVIVQLYPTPYLFLPSPTYGEAAIVKIKKKQKL